ncbi:MAG TPA: alpha/beta hydrolase [Thermomicrobiaceae bacterium]|nr:alpha/beta hydrolase [Thermomicrobiaceae bacterium]
MPYVNAGGVRLYYESAGEGTPLLLHGHGHMGWMPFQVPYFSQYYRIIVFDRRGTGRSDDPPGPWTVADLARDVRNLMDALGIDRAIVGGASLGGIISSQFGLDYPERARALIVGHTTPYFWTLAREWLQEQIAAAQRNEPVVVYQPRSYDWETQGPPTVASGFRESPTGQYLGTLNRDLGGREATVKMLSSLIDWDQRPRYPELQRLDVPALVIVGGNEPQKTIELSYEWHQQFKLSDYVILPNAHHGATTENPIGWNQAVHGFLRRRVE